MFRGTSVLRALVPVLLAGVALCAARPARAEFRVVVMPFKGDDSDAVQADVENLIRENHTFVSGDRFLGTARKMNITKATEGNIAKVARSLKVDAILYGQVASGRGSEKKGIRILLRSGKSGAVVDEPFTLRSKRSGLDKSSTREFVRELRLRLGLLDQESSARNFDNEREVLNDDEEGDEREKPPEDEEEETEKPKVDDDEEEEEETPDPDDAVLSSLPEDQRSDRLARSRAVELRGGLVFLKRNLEFKSAANLGAMAPRGYSGGTLPALRIEGEVYPLAFNLARNGIGRDFGAMIVLEKSLTIESKYPDMPMVNLPTEFVRYGLGGIFRKNFGVGPLKPTLKIVLGISKNRFTIDRSQAKQMMIDIGLPNVSYLYVDPGAMLRFPFTSKLRANGTARGRVVLDSGEISKGTEYGTARVLGFEFDASLEYLINDSFSGRAGANFTGYMYTFKGTGNKSDRNGDMKSDVPSALDRYIGAYLLASYIF